MIAARPSPELRRVENAPPQVRRGRSFHRRRRMFAGAVMLLLAFMCLAAFILVAVRMMISEDRSLGYIALGLLGVFVLLRGVAWYITHDLRCQLCHGHVLRDRGCHKHRDAAKLPFLSHRLSAAVMVVVKRAFNCMYCGTSFRLKKQRD